MATKTIKFAPAVKTVKKAAKKVVEKKVGFAALTKAQRQEMARKGGLTRVANAKAKAEAEVKAAKKAARAIKKK